MELEKIAVASGNRAKTEEIRSIFTGVEIVTMHELGFDGDIPETGISFRENAELKAKFIAEKFNLPALADDSGLCVDALGGAPGIYSARFSGGGEKKNRELLIKKLDGVSDRGAHFESCVCLYFPDGTTFFGEGRAYGRILTQETGENGFGYDSLFFSEDLQKSFGVASADEKNSVSHRFRALCDLKDKL